MSPENEKYVIMIFKCKSRFMLNVWQTKFQLSICKKKKKLFKYL